jgi:outer membrane protein, heavy metal efflux system
MPTTRSLTCAVCCLVLSGICAAQTSTFDLKTALQMAELNNLELRAIRQQRAISLAGLTTARQLPNPTVAFSAARDSPHEGLTVDLPIELGGKRGKRVAVAREEQRAAELEINILSRQVRRRTREAFYRALSSRAQTEQAKSALDLATRLKEIVQQRFDAGDVAQLEVIQTEVELARSSADYELIAAAERSADVQLAALLGHRLDQQVAPQGRVDELPNPQSLPAVTELAMKQNSELQRATQELQIEERRLALAKSQRIPNLNLQVGSDFNSPPDFQVGPKGQIGVTLPLFYHGQGEVALSTARMELLRLTLQFQQINAWALVAAAYFDFEAKARQAQRYQQIIVPQSVRLAQMAEESYREGKSNLLTLIDAQRKLNDVRKAYLDSLFAVQSSFAALEEVVGTPLD